MIVENDEVTLLDWGSAESTLVPHFEIISILEDSLSDNDPLFSTFLKGYGIDQEEYVAMKPDIFVLTLLQAVDKLRWAIDRKPDKIDEFSKKIVKILQGGVFQKEF